MEPRGAVLYIGAPLPRMFGLSFDYLMGPLAIQEMVMALWLIVKGFNQAAVKKLNETQESLIPIPLPRPLSVAAPPRRWPSPAQPGRVMITDALEMN